VIAFIVNLDFLRQGAKTAKAPSARAQGRKDTKKKIIDEIK